MKTSFFFFPIIGVFLLLPGCDNPKSTQWYKAHPDELNARYKTCLSSGQDSQDCRNAREARFELSQENAPIPDFNK